MNKGRTYLASFCILFAITATAAVSANAQFYSGRATGINSTVTINGSPSTTAVADTCPLSSTGGSHIATTPVGFIAGIVRTGPITSTTSGAGLQSNASSTVQDLDLRAGGYIIRATSVNATAQCNCCVPQTPACSGRTSIAGLTVTDPQGNPVAVVPNGTVNQTISLGAAGSIIINEQAAVPGDITVNALHVNITGANGTNTNVIVASAHADIECLATSPTASIVGVSGRVVDSNGNGVCRATVTLTSGSNTLTTRTTFSGGFTFAEVQSGQTYILEATHPSYSFSPVVLNVLEEITNAEVRANPARVARK